MVWLNDLSSLTNEECSFGTIAVQKIKKIFGVNIWSVIIREGDYTKFDTILYAGGIYTTIGYVPNFWPSNAAC
jgi:hypothetical protein